MITVCPRWAWVAPPGRCRDWGAPRGISVWGQVEVALPWGLQGHSVLNVETGKGLSFTFNPGARHVQVWRCSLLGWPTTVSRGCRSWEEGMVGFLANGKAVHFHVALRPASHVWPSAVPACPVAVALVPSSTLLSAHVEPPDSPSLHAAHGCCLGAA